MDINARLEKLERENRRMKKIGIVAAVFAAVLFISGQAKTNKSSNGAQKFSLEGKAVVEANEFRLLDSAGKVRAEIFFAPDSNDPKLLFRDADGNTDAELGASSFWKGLLKSRKAAASIRGISYFPRCRSRLWPNAYAWQPIFQPCRPHYAQCREV